ncbi:MAG: hypothetical protein ACYS29_04940, partial [Planctomycetota bacterium]
MKRRPSVTCTSLLCAIVILAWTAGGRALATKTDAGFRRAIIKPSLVRLERGQQQKFKAIMLATYLMAARAPQEVIWSVNGIAGGNRQFGTIDPNGLYTAPKKTPKP